MKEFIDEIDFIEADISKEGNWQKFLKIPIGLFISLQADIVPSIEDPKKYFIQMLLALLTFLNHQK